MFICTLAFFVIPSTKFSKCCDILSTFGEYDFEAGFGEFEFDASLVSLLLLLV